MKRQPLPPTLRRPSDGEARKLVDTDDEKLPLAQLEDIYSGSLRSYNSETKAWDVFRTNPPTQKSESNANQKCQRITVQILKVLAYIVTFLIVLCSAVIAKATFLFMTSQIRGDRSVEYCNKFLQRGKRFQAVLGDTQRVAWIWCIFFAYLIPELGVLFRSTRMCVFKSWKRPVASDFFVAVFFETCHVLGLSLCAFVVFPNIDIIKGIMFTNCICFAPALFSLLSRHTEKTPSKSKRLAHYTKVWIDMLAVLVQLSGFVVWPLVESLGSGGSGSDLVVWCIPVAALLTSCGWWENFVDKKSPFTVVRWLGSVKDRINWSRYYIYIFVSMWKMAVFFGSMLLFLRFVHGDHPGVLFSKMPESFGDHIVNIKEVLPQGIGDLLLPDLDVANKPFSVDSHIKSSGRHATFTLIIHVISAWLCYVFGKFACKVCIQGFSYAFPVNLTVPVTLSLLIAACGLRNDDSCFASDVLPGHLYWQCPEGDFLYNFMTTQHGWIWLLWLLSQTWITVHIWTPKGERLSTTEKIFVTPMYTSFFIDQSLALNRRRDEGEIVKTDDVPGIDDDIVDDTSPHYETVSVYSEIPVPGEEKKSIKSSDNITRIYATGTMWHETSDEMIEMLKSIFRMDEDQSARRVAQKYLKVVDPDYYEFETHIMFDDCFECADDMDVQVVNRFVRQLVSIIDDAAAHVHQIQIKLRPPKKYPTPYGGRLVWTLPGKTKIVCHLKDKEKIRHRKRWSQVMYMYYLLGHRLMELPISVDRKEVIAENTYLLALDGDIDFQPSAVQLLVDLMKKNKNLGAACGRIHPVGSGPMQWYQKFEYAIGHWLQKSTEHMIGCVLCSPGCFSLFRGKALMDDNVMKKYTTLSHQPRHYVQYDQGEDRWLCTLLLQRGYRVEYSAASDAYTHCPEGFSEFYNQRRRWVPSTMANIMDLLMSSKETIKVNDNISLPYIVYQFMLIIGTILGPGTIFLMLLGAFVAAFHIDNWSSFYMNLGPIILFIFVCFVFDSKIQLIVAQILSTCYALVMMAVIVGTSLQLGQDGIGSPSAIFLIALSGSFMVAAMLHPQEFTCIFHGFLYLITIPSMYLLLIIYSLVNLNNVSWGTREVQSKKTKKEIEEEKREAEEARKKRQQNALLGFFRRGDNEQPDEEGSIEFSLAGLFKIMCCVHPKPIDEKHQLLRISDNLEEIMKRLDLIERVVDPNKRLTGNRKNSSRLSTKSPNGLQAVSEGSKENGAGSDEMGLSTDEESSDQTPKLQRDDLINPYWLEDPIFRRGSVEYLAGPEIAFWKELLAKYLHPLDMTKREKDALASDLKELRNRSFFFFFMSNAIFVLIVFLLQLNKDQLHVEWPFGIKTNITVVGDEVFVDKQYLQLEPIGLVFVFFFALILIIQFTAMLFHRFGTISHILASTELDCFREKKDELSEDAFLNKNAVAIVKELQRLKGLDGDYGSETGSAEGPRGNWPGRRKTIHALERHRKRKREIGTLDVAFKKRFFNISAQNQGAEPGPGRQPGGYLDAPVLDGFGMGRDALKALENRRNCVIEEEKGKKTRLETLGKKKGEQIQMQMRENGLLTGGVPNLAFEENETMNIYGGSLRRQQIGGQRPPQTPGNGSLPRTPGASSTLPRTPGMASLPRPRNLDV